jgi:hypothetical protein
MFIEKRSKEAEFALRWSAGILKEESKISIQNEKGGRCKPPSS